MACWLDGLWPRLDVSTNHLPLSSLSLQHENNILKHTYISAQSQDNSNDILLNYRKPEYRKFRKFGHLAWVHDEVVTFQKERNNFTKRFRLKTSVCF